jgi:hypothetical protein
MYVARKPESRSFSLCFGFSLLKLCKLRLKHVDSDYTSNLHLDFAAHAWLHWHSLVSKYVYHFSQYWSVNKWTEFIPTLYTVVSVSYLQVAAPTPVSTYWVPITRFTVFSNRDWRSLYCHALGVIAQCLTFTLLLDLVQPSSDDWFLWHISFIWVEMICFDGGHAWIIIYLLRRTSCYYTRWFKYDRDKLWLVNTQIVPVIFEPPCMFTLQRFIFFETPTSL